jgi:hypothetical protein
MVTQNITHSKDLFVPPFPSFLPFTFDQLIHTPTLPHTLVARRGP